MSFPQKVMEQGGFAVFWGEVTSTDWDVVDSLVLKSSVAVKVECVRS